MDALHPQGKLNQGVTDKDGPRVIVTPAHPVDTDGKSKTHLSWFKSCPVSLANKPRSRCRAPQFNFLQPYRKDTINRRTTAVETENHSAISAVISHRIPKLQIGASPDPSIGQPLSLPWHKTLKDAFVCYFNNLPGRFP